MPSTEISMWILDTTNLPASPSALHRTKKQGMVQGRDTAVEAQPGDQEITGRRPTAGTHTVAIKQMDQMRSDFQKSSLTTSPQLQQVRKPALLKTLYRNWTLQGMAQAI